MSGGILGNAGGGAAGGLLGGFDQFVRENNAALIGAASGLLGGGGWGAAAQGFQQGMLQDERTRLIQQERAKEEQKRVAAQQLAQKIGAPELADFPELAGQLYMRQKAPKEYSLQDQWLRKKANEDPAFLDTYFGSQLGPKPTDDLREYQVAQSQGYAGSFLDYQKEIKRAGAQNINVGGGSDKQIFDEMKASADAARSAATGWTAVQQARQAVQSGGIFGAGADTRLELQKIGAQLGVADPAKIVNTETFRSAIAPQVSAMMKATVGSTQISNADRDFAEKAAGGSIELDPNTITRLLDIMERANDVVIERHAQRLDAVYPDTPEFKRERALFGVTRPSRSQPSPGAIDRSTIEQEARRRGLIR